MNSTTLSDTSGRNLSGSGPPISDTTDRSACGQPGNIIRPKQLKSGQGDEAPHRNGKASNGSGGRQGRRSNPLARPQSPDQTTAKSSRSYSQGQGQGQGQTVPQQGNLLSLFAKASSRLFFHSVQQGPPLNNADGIPGSFPSSTPQCDQLFKRRTGSTLFECPVCLQKLEFFSDREFQLHVNDCLDSGLDDPNANGIMPESQRSIMNIGGEVDDDIIILSEGFSVSGAVSASEPLLPAEPTLPHRSFRVTGKSEGVGPKEKGGKSSSSPSGLFSRRVCPWFKWIPDTSFTVDAFCYGAIPNCSAYFLSHFHSDHYGGLSGAFVYGPIYCSRITANLIRLKFSRVRHDLINVVPMGRPTEIQGATVTCFDANHCPGAVMFLFETSKGTRHLHVGDFRACEEMLEIPDFKTGLDSLYLDTTYLKPCHTFPPQRSVIDVVAELARRVALGEPLVVGRPPTSTKFLPPLETGPLGYSDPYQSPSLVVHSHLHMRSVFRDRDNVPVRRLLVVVGTYSIGKEKIFLGICRALHALFYCDDAKWAVLSCYEDPELIQWYTPDPAKAGVHVVPLSRLTPPQLFDHLDRWKDCFSHLLAVKPTGWTFTDAGRNGSVIPKHQRQEQRQRELAGQQSLPALIARMRGETLGSSVAAVAKDNCSKGDCDGALYMCDLTPQYSTARVAVFGVPYSEHSSYDELSRFVRGVSVRCVIPTVPVDGVGPDVEHTTLSYSGDGLYCRKSGNSRRRQGPFACLDRWCDDVHSRGGVPFSWHGQ